MKRKAGQIRIIGGLIRRTPVAVVGDVEQMRPTPDRVRETLFNWLGESVRGSSCLDLFAGSGVLGLEAASRGASSVLFVDKHSQAQAALQAQIDRLLVAKDPAVQVMAQGLSMVKGDATQSLGRLQTQGRRFNLVFLDPPFSQDWQQRLASALPDVLTEKALVYYESSAEITSWPVPAEAGRQANKRFERVRYDCAGQVHYHLFSYQLGDPL